MKPRTSLVLVAGGGLLFLGAFVWLLTTHGPLAPVGIRTTRVVRADLNHTVFGIGTVEARVTYPVGPVAPGRVLRVLADQGDVVKAGQLLAEMDPVDLDRRVQSAQSAELRARQAVQAADAQVAEAESRAKLARANQDRSLALFEQQAIPSKELDASRSEAERAEAAVVAARASAAAAKQDIERIGADVLGIRSVRDSQRLVSPVDGVIVSREAEPGTTVVAGQAVFRLVAPQTVWVRARVDQSRAHGLQVGQPARIVLRSSPDEPIPGRVARIELQSDPVTEERLLDVAFDGQPARLYLGELAEVTVQLPGEPGVLAVPSAAIARESGERGVWRERSGRAHFSPVAVGAPGEDGVTRIRSGLAEGDQIIVYSAAELREGVRVREGRVEQP